MGRYQQASRQPERRSRGEDLRQSHVDKFDAEQVQKTYGAWQEVIKKAPHSIVVYEFFHRRKVTPISLEDAAFARRDDFQTVLCEMMGFEDDYTTSAWNDQLKLRRVVSGSSLQAAQDTSGYANYADPFCTQNDTDQYARKLFGTKYARLQEVKKKYDPDMAFDRWFTVRPTAYDRAPEMGNLMFARMSSE
ncbi:hypothetical protein FRC04_010382 [Tulasnella sp. 424]|nr:hypothetical protein FRC04_010382 [Tulasnella sp. 424]KAG8978682.1 hypothetical protein FRC05_009954 [Tulasnella sp. 425]